MDLQVTDKRDRYVTSTAVLHYPPAGIAEIQQAPAEQDSDTTTPRLVHGPAGGTAPPNRWLSGLPDSSCPPTADRGVRGMTDELLAWLWQPPWATLMPVSPS